jgi:hypothetical protein
MAFPSTGVRRADGVRAVGRQGEGMVVDSLGGYRVIRKLGDGARAEVFLGHADEASEPMVALKAYRPGTPDAAAMTEAQALHRGAGVHVLRMIDVVPGADGAPVLVLERLAGGSLERLLQQRERLRAGEAITILAPIAQAVARLHDAGVLHGGIAERTVLFDGGGAPVLACFGRARLVEPALSQAGREADVGFAADLAQFAAVARTVLERTDEPGAPALLESPGTLTAFAGRLFELGEPLPVRFDASGVQPRPVPARLVRAEGAVEVQATAPAALAVPDWIERMLPASVPETLDRLRSALATVRRPVWIAAAAVGVALIGALVLVPTGGTPDAAPPVPTSSPTAKPADAGPVAADDPVAAAIALLAARERCLRDLSVLCLDAVGQAGSAALAEDQELVRRLQDGGEFPALPQPDRATATVVERLGDSAIVSLGPNSEPASVLLMKGEAGWRIREYLSG